MERLDKETAMHKMNVLGSEKIPFVFVIDFEMQKIIVSKITNLDNSIHLQFPSFSFGSKQTASAAFKWNKFPVSLQTYQKGFEYIQNEIQKGNTFLANLTYPTEIENSGKLSDIYNLVKAKYKILIDSECVVFSPETFVKITEGHIHTFPMKGTIDADLPDALSTILHDQKEIAEHYTIVDLLRNDLSKVAKQVKVVKFRYPEYIETNSKKLIQISSEIKGKLPKDFHCHIGNIVFELLPAGSVSGAPKKKTVEIIQTAEGRQRGYYTGVAGYFDGSTLDSTVMIRFVEKQGDSLLYRSGGGITFQSKLGQEYQEMIDKVYLPNTLKSRSESGKILQV